MVKLDPTYLSFMTKDDIRVLTSVELGMKNHETVPIHLIEVICKLKQSPTYQILKELIRNKLVIYEKTKNHQGYRLTYLGYDYLALNTFIKRGLIKKVYGKLGVGKESDIYKCSNPEGEVIVLKLGRLGRTSFRTIKRNRDYIQHRKSYNWLYLSRIAALKEFTYMQALHENGFITPKPIDWNRHAILMSYIDGLTLCKYKDIENPEPIYHQLMDTIEKLASYGVIHSDFNEFNLILPADRKAVVIDFPQMVSMSHQLAQFYFDRDVNCIVIFFKRRFDFTCERIPAFADQKVVRKLDVEIKASGFVKTQLGNDGGDGNTFDILDEYRALDDESDNDNEEEHSENSENKNEMSDSEEDIEENKEHESGNEKADKKNNLDSEDLKELNENQNSQKEGEDIEDEKEEDDDEDEDEDDEVDKEEEEKKMARRSKHHRTPKNTQEKEVPQKKINPAHGKEKKNENEEEEEEEGHSSEDQEDIKIKALNPEEGQELLKCKGVETEKQNEYIKKAIKKKFRSKKKQFYLRKNEGKSQRKFDENDMLDFCQIVDQ